MKLKLLLAVLLVLVPACAIRHGGNKYDLGLLRRDADTELHVSQGDTDVTFVHHGPFPLLGEPSLTMDVERDGDKVKVHIETGTKTKVAGSSYTQWVTAAFSFLAGVFVAK